MFRRLFKSGGVFSIEVRALRVSSRTLLDARDVALSATSSARYNSYSWLLLRKYSVPAPSALWITSLMLFKEQQLSVIEQIRNCNRSLAIVGAWHSPPCYTYQCAHIQADVDRYLQSVYWSGCARSIFGSPPPLRRQISRSTGTEGFLLDRDYLISESFNFANPPKNIAKNENSKNINIIKPNKNRATTNIKNFASKLL